MRSRLPWPGVGKQGLAGRSRGTRRCSRKGKTRMGVRTWIEGWPAYRQATGPDRTGRGAAVKSGASERLTARTASADKVVKSVCPYCAVGCGQDVYVTRVEGGEVGRAKVGQIEGDP